MNNLQKRKLKKRVVVALISMLSCIAVMAVGVYAATNTFAVEITNQVAIDISQVDGELYAKRYGDVIYGNVSMGEEGFEDLGTDYSAMNASMEDFILIYGYDGTAHTEVAENMAEIKEPVNFYTTDKETLSIYYVFEFDFHSSSPTNISITLTNNSTSLDDGRADKVEMTYKYYFGKDEPDWQTGGTLLGHGDMTSATVKVMADEPATHTVFIYASMTVERTNTLADAYTLGVGEEDYHWRFNLAFTPESKLNTP